MTTTAIPVAVPTVRIAGGTFSDDVRAMKMVWRRELIRFFRNRIRIFTSLMQELIVEMASLSILDRSSKRTGPFARPLVYFALQTNSHTWRPDGASGVSMILISLVRNSVGRRPSRTLARRKFDRL